MNFSLEGKKRLKSFEEVCSTTQHRECNCTVNLRKKYPTNTYNLQKSSGGDVVYILRKSS